MNAHSVINKQLKEPHSAFGNVKNAIQSSQAKLTCQENNMVMLKCMDCNKEIDSKDVKRRVRCTHCGSKTLSKPTNVSTVFEAI